MIIDAVKVANGDYDGKELFICHLNIPDILKKPLRNIEPTKVLIISENDPVNKGKRVNYSNSLFQTYSKDGKLSKKTLKIYDNTGYRSFRGNPVYIFDNFDDCVAQWKNDCDQHVQKIVQYKNDAVDTLDKMIIEYTI